VTNASRLEHLNDLIILPLRAVSLPFAAPGRSQDRPGRSKFNYSVVNACPAHSITAVRSGLAYVRPMDDMHAGAGRRPVRSRSPRSGRRVVIGSQSAARSSSLPTRWRITDRRPNAGQGCSDRRSHRIRMWRRTRGALGQRAGHTTKVIASARNANAGLDAQSRGGRASGAGGTTGSGTSGRRRR